MASSNLDDSYDCIKYSVCVRARVYGVCVQVCVYFDARLDQVCVYFDARVDHTCVCVLFFASPNDTDYMFLPILLIIYTASHNNTDPDKEDKGPIHS